MGASIERELPVVLTQEEKDKSAHDCAEKELELRRVEAEAKDTMSGYRATMKKLRAEIKTLAEESETGKRTAKVPCREISDWPNPTVVVREDGRSVEGVMLPPGSPPAVIETKAPEVQEVESDKRQAEAPDPRQGDLFAQSGGGGAEPPAEVADEEAEEDEEEERDADDEEVDAGEGDAPPPRAGAQSEAKAASGKSRAPRKLKLVGATN